MHIEHWIDDPALPVEDILQVYGHRFRHRLWSKLSQVRADLVSAAWQAIATVHLLDGRPNPRKPRGSSSHDLDLRLSHQLRTYSFQDLPPLSRSLSPFTLSWMPPGMRALALRIGA